MSQMGLACVSPRELHLYIGCSPMASHRQHIRCDPGAAVVSGDAARMELDLSREKNETRPDVNPEASWTNERVGEGLDDDSATGGVGGVGSGHLKRFPIMFSSGCCIMALLIMSHAFGNEFCA